MTKTPPPPQPPNEPEWLFPFHSLRVGDSFFVPTMRPAYMLFIIDTTSKKAGVRVKTFVTTKDGVLGVRAWRTR